MLDIEDKWFERWCRSGDPQALAELFDAAAPRLVKLAIHLVGDAATAEDLVQATFLAAIEQRATLDGSRPVMPWLTSVLSIKARQLRRERAKEISIDRLHERVVEAPDAALERRELSGELAAAIDKLGEPYRQVLLLRARHGMEIADIAHVLERDPGTVRVQLHRGVERLRHLLPAALATSLLVGLIAPRGLAAVKASVLSEAAAAVSVASTTGMIGGLLVSKKLVIAACLVVLAVLVVVWKRADSSADMEAASKETTTAEVALPTGATTAPLSLSGTSTVVEATRDAVASVAQEDDVFTGSVIDAKTRAPIAGAMISIFKGRTATAYELQRDSPEFFVPTNTGRLRSRAGGDWPRIVETSEAELAGRERLTVLDVPRSGDEPLASTITDAEGRFWLRRAVATGLVEVAGDGYATRWYPIVEDVVPERFELWREREVHGVVVNLRGEPILEPIELSLTAAELETVETSGSPDSDSNALAGTQVRKQETLACQRVRCASDGTFRTNIVAASIEIDVITPGWDVPFNIVHDLAESGLTVKLSRTPVMHFFDSESGEPIERVRLLGREQRNGYSIWSGELHAPLGRLSLPGSFMFLSSHLQGTLGLIAWSDGYEAASWSITQGNIDGVLEVPMTRGELASIEGDVLRDGEPLDGALVSLLGYSALQWSENDESSKVIDGQAARNGHFRFEAAPGKYVLHVQSGSQHNHRVVELPASTPLVIDLSRLSSIEVEIVDEMGAIRADHLVVLHSIDGRVRWGSTDDRGRATFADLPAGPFHILTVHVNTTSSFTADVIEPVELLEARHEFVQIQTRASTGPRYARVAARGTSQFSGWRARYDEDAWVELEADGKIPLDLTTERWTLSISAPDSRAWTLSIPKNAPDGHVIELDSGEGRYEGELLDAEGAPMAGVTVIAQPWGDCTAFELTSESITDQFGRFQIGGLETCVHLLRFKSEGAALSTNFLPSQAPSSEARFLHIRLVELGSKTTWSGVVRDASGNPRSGMRVSFQCTIPQTDGALQVVTPNLFTHTNADGSFETRLPRTPKCSISVQEPKGGAALLHVKFEDDGSASRRVELAVPDAQ